MPAPLAYSERLPLDHSVHVPHRRSGLGAWCVIGVTILFVVALGSGVTLGLDSAVHATIIGGPAITPATEESVTFTILQMNDVYEILPVSNKTRGGLARVATIRRWLQEQNSDVITMMAGDMVAPCALDAATPPTSKSRLDGKHMVAVMNTLGLDFMTFGNHEFDIPKAALVQRIAESRFEWISTNVLDAATGKPFANVSQYRLLDIRGCRVMIIALTVDENLGEGNYVKIIPPPALPDFLQNFILPFQGKYDVLVALTHLPIASDVLLAESVPHINLIIGGHDHEGWHLWRGPQNTHITKADSNAATVFVHRISFGLQSRKVTIQRRLVQVDQDIPEDPAVAEVAQHWYTLAFKKFERLGLHPAQTIAALPEGLELDGRDRTLRNAPALLSQMVCEAQVKSTAEYKAVLGLINGGLIRIDDRIAGTISEYDVIRMFPFPNVIVAVKAKGRLLAKAFDWGLQNRGKGLFAFPCGATLENGVWVTDTGVALNSSDDDFVLATNSYLLEVEKCPLSSPEVTLLGDVGIYTPNFIRYLGTRF